MGCRHSRYGSIIGAVFVFICICGCTKPAKTVPGPVQTVGTQEENPVNAPSIQTIVENSTDYSGEVITLHGIFKGWKGNCRSVPPVSRSDWMIQDATGCMYINGPLPDGRKASDPDNQPVTVRGTVRVNRDGIPYLERMP